LTILGGLGSGHDPGVTVLWFPAFNPPDPPPTSKPGSGLHSSIRDAMRNSVLHSQSFFYSTARVTLDFFLFARGTPHFSGTFDPVSILLLSEAQGESYGLECYQFPPHSCLVPENPTTAEPPTPASEPISPSDTFSKDLASTLESMESGQDPKHQRLLISLASGDGGILDAQIVKLDQEPYRQFVGNADASDGGLPMKGGRSWFDEAKADEMKLGKVCNDPSRILL
jgi:syntaxin-binding protein 5